VQTCLAQSLERVAVITEMKLNHGDIRIRAAGGNAFERPLPLQSLYPGTRIEVSEDALVTILFTREAKSLTIGARLSPYEITEPAETGARFLNRFASVASELFGTRESRKSTLLGTRGKTQPVVLVMPRNSKLLTDTLTFQWSGVKEGSASLKVHGLEGPLWRADNLAGRELTYPPTAPRLKPGIEYTWNIEEQGVASEKAWFSVLTPEELAGVEEKLAAVQNATGLSKSTQSLVKALLLASHELYHDARQELLQAIKSDPREPTLRFLLAEIYERTGLISLATEEFERTQRLLRKGG
jgi:hypothetical protein